MSLKCGIIGIANVGKSTLFNCMSNTKVETTSFAFTSNKSNIGIVDVPDPRLYNLENFQPTEKIIPATVEIVDIPGLAKGANKGEGVGNQFLSDIRNTDALIHVLRCFDDENLPHIEGSVNPVRDIETINLELQVKDLESVEKKITRLEKLAKVGDKDAKKGIEVLQVYKDHLENFQNASTAPVSETDRKYIDDLFLLTAKPVMYVCNVDDASATTGNKYVDEVKSFLQSEAEGAAAGNGAGAGSATSGSATSGSATTGKGTTGKAGTSGDPSTADTGPELLVLAGRLEEEIAELDPEDRAEFLADAGLTEPGVNKLIRSAYSMLNLMSFFTVGPKENRAWTIRKGMTAPQAAGVIHSDLERGFIRAEVMKYNDFIELGSEQACKVAGKLAVEGKNYVVGDGDILHIRFNV
ncbi:MAG: redox-regulated ATPase YchF [Bacteroidales bacterium]|nr:redox-regulated ATPase YchF [Bacteroidales bacterium]